MKYSKRQLKGLIDSIDKKWIPIVCKKKENEGSEDCPLCDLYNNSGSSRYSCNTTGCCKGCPIRKHTGIDLCGKTPYDDIVTNTKIRIFSENNLKELQFLILLLPKVNQKKYKKYMKK